MYKNIMVVINLDDPHRASALLKNGYKMLDHDDPNAVIRVCGVVAAPKNTIVSSFLQKNFDKDILAEANTILHQLTKSLCDKSQRVQHIVCYGAIAEEVMKHVNNFKSDLIILSAFTDKKDTIASSSVKIIRQASCPVLVLR